MSIKFVCGIILLLFICAAYSPLLVLCNQHITADNLCFFSQRTALLFAKSVGLACGVALVSVIIAIFLLYFLQSLSKTANIWLSTVFICPIFIPPYFQASAWISVVSRFPLPKPFSIYSWYGAIFILSLSFFSYAFFLCRIGLRQMGREKIEAGELMQSPHTVFYGVTLPFLMPYIFTSLLFIVFLSLTNYGVFSLLRINTFAVEIFTEFSTFYNETQALVLSLPIILLLIVSIVTWWVAMKGKVFFSAFNFKESRDTKPTEVTFGKIIKYGFVGGMITVFTAPLIYLIFSISKWEIFLKTFYDSWDVVVITVLLCGIAALCSTIMSFFIGYYIFVLGKKRGTVVELLTLLPLCIPPALVGIGLIRLSNYPVFSLIYGTWGMAVLVIMIRFSPLIVEFIYSGFKQIPISVIEAGRLVTGCNGCLLISLFLPLLSKHLIISFFFVFALGLSEIAATILVIPPGFETLSIRIYSLLHYGAGRSISALLLIILGVVMLPVIIFSSVRKKEIIFDNA